MREGKIELHAFSKGHYPGERMDPDILSGISSLGFWSCGKVQDWGLNAHRNEGIRLLDLVADQQIEASAESMTKRRTVGLFLKDLSESPASIAEPWTLETMANQCGMGLTSLAKYLRILVNIGPMAYLNECRLEHAARELKERPGSPVTAIAFRMGFNSSQYFATMFKQRFAVTPKQYGKQRVDDSP